ncbi:hypothetical protein [Kalamiella sp. sgz302252]|uniref:hypothetical protein n=1 Tax=Pantoea sp. sgz302252 TaxID=3341827 RepID=UPI0036D3A582
MRIIIIAREARVPALSRERKKVAAALAEKIVPAMRPTLPGQLLPKAYPWCFVLPPLGKRDRFYVGALTTDEKAAVSALYAAVSYRWLQEALATNFHPGFWLARIMTVQQGVAHQDRPLKSWLDLLRSHYSPLREKLLNESYRFRSQSDLLLAGHGEFDDILTEDKGVGRMPWPEWPAAIRAGNQAWLWRQSRYGKIIDSQRLDW